MWKNKKYLSALMAFMLMITCVMGATGIPVSAAESKINFINTEYTDSKVVAGDSLTIKSEFYPVSETVTITGVDVSGSVDKTNMSYEITNGSELHEGQIAPGNIMQLTINGLKYTGEGTDVTITLQYQGGSAQKTITLNAVTNEAIKGALILDPAVDSNMSVSMNAGESKKLSLEIKNTSSSTIKDAVIKIGFAETTLGLAVTEGQYIEIASLAANKTKTIEFTVSADKSVKSGTYKINAEINGVKQTIYLEIGNSDIPPSLELSINANQIFKRGETNNLELQVKNIGDTSAKNVKVEIKNKDTVAVLGSSNVRYITEIGAKASETLSIPVQIDNNASSMVLLEVGLTYKNESGESTTDTQTIYLNTNTLTTSSDVRITNVTNLSNTYMANQDFTINFVVQSSSGAENVKVSINTPNNIIPKSQSVFILPSLEAGKSQNYSVTLSATDQATTSNYPIEIVAEYTYNNEKITQSQYTGVNIYNEEDEEEEESKSEPKVIVGNYSLAPEVVQAGEEVEVGIELLNTHSTKKVYNLIATYSITESGTNGDTVSSVFTPVNSGNTLFESQIATGSKVNQSIVFKTSDSATSKTYTLNIAIEYEDEDGNQIKTTQTLGIPVQQASMIEVGEVDVSTLSVGKSTGMTITLYNRSKSDISNVMVFLEGEGFTVKDNKNYISTFSKGATEYYLPTITPTADGKLNVEMVIQYEDDQGEVQEMRYPLDLSTSSAEKMGGSFQGAQGMPENMTPEMAQGMKEGRAPEAATTESTTNVWLIGGGVVAVAAAGFALYKVLKQRKRLKDMNTHE